MSKHTPSAFADYMPVELRHRHDGWTPVRQVEFLVALSETACVEDACRAVGMSPASAYALRRRIEAAAFRAAWDSALDYGVRRLADAALSRALHGVSRPVFYKGELIGERRYFDERLTMFILRLRDPVGHGKWRERTTFTCAEDGPARLAEHDLDRAIDEAERDASRTGLFRHLRDIDADDDDLDDDDGGDGGPDIEDNDDGDDGQDNDPTGPESPPPPDSGGDVS